MKYWITLGVFSVAIGLVACGSKGGGSSAPTGSAGATAVTPQPCNNQGLPGSYSNCQAYQSYYSQQSYSWQYGAWYWPTPYNPQVGNCGCNAGYSPVQGPYGVACSPTAYFSAYGGGVNYANGYGPGTMPVGYGNGYGYPATGYNPQGYWNYGQNNGYTSQPQAYYSSAYTNGCSSGIAQGCDVRLNNCSGGTRCQPVAGGSTIGLCVR